MIFALLLKYLQIVLIILLIQAVLKDLPVLFNETISKILQYNRKNNYSMKHSLLVCLFLIIITSISSANNCNTGSSIFNFQQLPDSLPVVAMIFAGSEKNPYFVDSLHYFESIDSAKHFMKNKNLDGPLESTLESSNYVFLLAAYRGVDCHSKFEIDLFDNANTKEYIFTVKVIYGGCRAGGKSYLNWYKIPKLPDGYKLKYHRYYVDPKY